jgi:hypothetical protein
MGFRHVLRRLRRSPLFTTITVVTLALGMGANVAIFSVLEGVLLKPLPYPDPDHLIAVDHAAPGVNIDSAGMARSYTSRIGTKTGRFRTLPANCGTIRKLRSATAFARATSRPGAKSSA